MDKNIFGTPLQKCSKNTGYFRNGYCTTGPSDSGKHTVCATMNPKFMKFTASRGNDLSSVVKPNENWCLCQSRYEEAFDSRERREFWLQTSCKETKTSDRTPPLKIYLYLAWSDLKGLCSQNWKLNHFTFSSRVLLK